MVIHDSHRPANTAGARSAGVRVRIAPSPTGSLHVGTARAALFNEIYARQHKGRLIIRIEDTDRKRSRPEHEKEILAGLAWLGLTWDEGPDAGGDFGPYRQSERGDTYEQAIAKLLESNLAYRVKDSDAIKLNVDPQEVVFEDLIRGRVVIHSDTWGGDFVIARGPSDPVYHLAVVVDDAAQQISHIIRGEDHLTNTARHILLQQALGFTRPLYAHLPLLLDEKRRKLSKRMGETSLLAFRDQGYLPEAMLNYLALLGWNPGGDREFFTHEELIELFDLVKVQKGGAIFSVDKLDSINQHYLRQKSREELYDAAKGYSEDILSKPLQVSPEALLTEQKRVSTLAGLIENTAFARADWGGDYAPELLIWRKSTKEEAKELLQKLLLRLESLAESEFSKETLEKNLLQWIDEDDLGRGDVLWPMRVALTGQDHSPGPFEVAAALGKKETVRRLDLALGRLN